MGWPSALCRDDEQGNVSTGQRSLHNNKTTTTTTIMTQEPTQDTKDGVLS